MFKKLLLLFVCFFFSNLHQNQEEELLKINIIDNGIGRENARLYNVVKGTGTGLKVISQTIHLLNGKNQNKIEFSLIDMKSEGGESCGTKVDISIPRGYNFEIMN